MSHSQVQATIRGNPQELRVTLDIRLVKKAEILHDINFMTESDLESKSKAQSVTIYLIIKRQNSLQSLQCRYNSSAYDLVKSEVSDSQAKEE